LALLILGFSGARLIDKIFITATEAGEKGRSYMFEKYPSWRLIGF